MSCSEVNAIAAFVASSWPIMAATLGALVLDNPKEMLGVEQPGEMWSLTTPDERSEVFPYTSVLWH